VVSGLGDPAPVQDDDLVGHVHAGEAVRDQRGDRAGDLAEPPGAVTGRPASRVYRDATRFYLKSTWCG
jgi:hypothetical protein